MVIAYLYFLPGLLNRLTITILIWDLIVNMYIYAHIIYTVQASTYLH